MAGVSPARVSQWIGEGKIGPDALVGQGRGARININAAMAQLKERLDVSQRFGLNGLSTKLAPGELPLEPAPQAPARETKPPPAPLVDSVEAQIKAHKLRQTELATRRQEEEDRLARGVYILAADAQASTAKACGKLLEAIEGSLADIAGEFAAKYQIPSRDALHLLRAQLNKVRARVSADFAALAAAEPETVEDHERHDPAQDEHRPRQS